MTLPDPEELEEEVLKFCFQLHLKTGKYVVVGLLPHSKRHLINIMIIITVDKGVCYVLAFP